MSSCGHGTVFMQNQLNNTWMSIIYIYNSPTETEKCYAQIEKEALAAMWASEHLFSYLLGMKITVRTDYKPLFLLLGSRSCHRG